MNKNIYATIIICIILLNNLNAQTFTWARALLGSSSTQGQSVKTDAAGNVFTTGIFNGTTDFDPGAGIFNLAPVSLYDVYITKFNSAGIFVWAKKVGGMGTDYSYDLDLDATGNVYVVGRFDGTADFDPGVGSASLTPAGNSDIFILKLDNNGNYVWARNMGGTALDEGQSISIDPLGNVLTTGWFAGTADFDPGIGTFTLTTGVNYEIFVSKLDGSGNFVWAKQFVCPGSDTGRGITTDALGNVFSVGSFLGIADFDPGVGTYTINSGGTTAGAIVKLDALGNFVWAQAIIGGNKLISAVKIDPTGNVIISGRFSNTPDFDPGPGTFTMTTLAGADDILVEKLDASGNFVWAKQMGGPGQDNNYDLAVDNSGNAFTVGYFQAGGPADFDPGPGVYNFTSFGSNDAFISKLDNNGNFVSANQIGGASADGAYGVHIDASYNIYAVGNFDGTVDFDPGVTVSNLVGTGDGYVLKWSGCPAPPAQPGVITGSTSLCSGLISSYSVAPVGGATSYIWTFPLGWTGTSTTNIISPTSGLSGTISVAASNGCSSGPTRTLAVTVNASPTITVNSGSICSGQSFSITALGAGTYTFQGGSPLVFPLITSSYTVAGTSTAGCVSLGFATSNVTVNPNPTITVNSGSICAGQSFVIVPSGASTYTITGNNFTVSPLVNTSYSIIGTSTAGCVSSLAISNITVSASPTITVNSGSICSGQSFTIIPSGANTYTIQGGGAVKSPTITTAYTVTGTSTAGCVSQAFATSNITVSASPTITVNNGSICSGQSFTLIPGGASTYTFQGGSAVVNPTTNTSYTVVGTSTAGCVSQGFAISNVTVNANPTISVNSGSICSGNSFTIIPSGANTYTYQGGSQVVSPIINSSYTVAGTSTAGCVSLGFATSNITVSASPTISVNSGSICSGQSFTMIPSGANTYTFQGGSAVVSPIVNASYTVAGTSTAGCISQAFAVSNITVSASPTISVNSGSICLGNSFTMIPTGANTFTFQGGSAVVSPTVNSSYTVAGTSTAGCISQGFATSNVTINGSPLPTITVNSGSICSGNSFTIIPNGANTYTFQGGNAVVSPTANASYTVVGTNIAGCISQTFATSNVSVTAAPSISISSSGTICTGESATLTVSGANTYSWNTGPTTTTIVVSPTVTTSYTATGTSSVTGCIGTYSFNLLVSPCTGINNLTLNNDNFQFLVYPNPNNGEFTLEINLEAQIVISNILGQEVLNQKIKGDKQNFNIKALDVGIYFIKLINDKQTQTIKIVKE